MQLVTTVLLISHPNLTDRNPEKLHGDVIAESCPCHFANIVLDVKQIPNGLMVFSTLSCAIPWDEVAVGNS